MSSIPESQTPRSADNTVHRLHPQFFSAHVELSHYTSISCETILHQSIPSTPGVIRPDKTALRVHNRKPYSKAPQASSTTTGQHAPLRLTENNSVPAQARTSEPAGGSGNGDVSVSEDGGSNEGAGLELIPKPPGENGRPGRGGYSVSNEVQYDKEEWMKIEVCQIPESSLKSSLTISRRSEIYQD